MVNSLSESEVMIQVTNLSLSDLVASSLSGLMSRHIGDHELITYYYYYNRFTALWILSGITRVSRYQKGKTRKVKPIWIYWSKR